MNPVSYIMNPSLSQRTAFAAADILDLLPYVPGLGIVAGSGIAGALEGFEVVMDIDLEEHTDMPLPRVGGHSPRLQIIRDGDRSALVWLGRVHAYEGYSTVDTCLPTSVMHAIGVTNVLYTNAAGALSPDLRTGDLVLASDLLDDMRRVPPVRSSESTGSVLSETWTSAMFSRALDTGLELQRGTYLSVLGPSYETRAEIHMFRSLHADVIGMSTVPEATCASILGMRVAVLSVVTNALSDIATPILSHEEVVGAGADASQRLAKAIKTAIFTA